MLRPGSDSFTAGKRTEFLTWRPLVQVREDLQLAFDHAAPIAQAVRTTGQQTLERAVPAGFLEEWFTLGKLQAACEQVLGEPIESSGFPGEGLLIAIRLRK